MLAFIREGSNYMEARQENGEAYKVKKSEPVLARSVRELDHYGFYFLSSLDQNIAVFMQTVHVFKPDKESTGDFCEAIRGALAEVLVHFYPLSGTLTVSPDDKLTVECSERGVQFAEAVADVDIVVVTGSKMASLLHTIPGARSSLEVPLVTFQVTRFECGGAMNHSMVDGISATEFLNAWAETARGLCLSTEPFIDRSVLKSREPPKIEFPLHEFKEIEDISNTNILYGTQPIEYRSFCFDNERFLHLKKTAMEDDSLRNYTKYTLLAAFVWRARTKALSMEASQRTKLLFAVGARSKLEPPPLGIDCGWWWPGKTSQDRDELVLHLKQSCLSLTIFLWS